MKKLVSIATFLGLVWCVGVAWTASWIDRKSYSDFPGKLELSLARIFWQLSPNIGKSNLAERTFKLSWLTASTEINRKEKKEMAKILYVLAGEFRVIAKFLNSNADVISSELKFKGAVQLLTYLNRVSLFQKFSDPTLKNQLSIYEQNAGSSDPSTLENWHRELMIYGRLNNDTQLYEKHRDALNDVLRKNGRDLSSDFLTGVLAFYDGILSCISKEESIGVRNLTIASNNLKSFSKFTTNLLNQDLNVLLLGKGMESGEGCHDAISNFILTGA